jgi:hypothetical protein
LLKRERCKEDVKIYVYIQTYTRDHQEATQADVCIVEQNTSVGRAPKGILYTGHDFYKPKA